MENELELSVFEGSIEQEFKHCTNKELEEVLTKPQWMLDKCSPAHIEIMIKCAKEHLAKRHLKN